MRAGPSFAATATIAFVVLLMLAGVLFGAHHGAAQAQEACPLPAGATAVEPPDVTAPQVESGRGLLMDFALSVRERSIEHAMQATTVEQGLYIGCLVRQDDSAWRAGSTYIVTLALDGRVLLHAEDMSLSGRQLNHLIYAEILSALGVSQSVLADLASPDPATQESAFAALRRHTVAKSPTARSTPPCPWAPGRAFPAPPATPPSIIRSNCGLRSCCSRDSISINLTWFPSPTKTSTTATRTLPPPTSWTGQP